MPRLRRPDGAELEWRIEGDHGPLVVVAAMALHPPAPCRAIVRELAADHRVITYDLRGTGGSSRVGPYEIATDALDLAAVVEAAGGDALAVALGDGALRAVRAAVHRPGAIHTVAISGEVPLGPVHGSSSREALANSPAVLEAMLKLLETDYRTGLRSILTSGGDSEWHRLALRDRLDDTAGYCPPEVAVPRMRSWIRTDSLEQARSLGDRLWYLHFPGNAWFRGSLDAIRHELPDARFEAVSEGVISRPEENALAIRRILAGRRAAA
jgi:pimeloyl-ACP methyl ester carboxylesterase